MVGCNSIVPSATGDKMLMFVASSPARQQACGYVELSRPAGVFASLGGQVQRRRASSSRIQRLARGLRIPTNTWPGASSAGLCQNLHGDRQWYDRQRQKIRIVREMSRPSV